MALKVGLRLAFLMSLFMTQACSAPPEAAPGHGSSINNVCDAACSIENDDDSSNQTSYWKIDGLGCGGAAGCYATVAFYGDGVGEIAWGGTQSAYCLPGKSLLPQSFSFTHTSAGYIQIGNNGVPIQCSGSAGAAEAIQSVTNITGSLSSGGFSGDFELMTATVNYGATKMMGTF